MAVAVDTTQTIANKLTGDLSMDISTVIMGVLVVLNVGAALLLLRNLWP